MKQKKQLSEDPLNPEIRDLLDWYTTKLGEYALENHLYLCVSRPGDYEGAVISADFRKEPYSERHEDRRVFWITLVNRDLKSRYEILSNIVDIIDNWLRTATYH